MSKFDEAVESFKTNKKETSPFLKLSDGESADIKSLRSMKNNIGTDDKTGQEYAEMVFSFDIESEDGSLKAKVFKSSSTKLIEEMQRQGIDLGSSFTIKKLGEGLQTTYEISNVVNKNATLNAAAAPAQPSTNAGISQGTATPPTGATTTTPKV